MAPYLATCTTREAAEKAFLGADPNAHPWLDQQPDDPQPFVIWAILTACNPKKENSLCEGEFTSRVHAWDSDCGKQAQCDPHECVIAKQTSDCSCEIESDCGDCAILRKAVGEDYMTL